MAVCSVERAGPANQTKARGSITIWGLVNMRCSYRFKYFQADGNSGWTMLGESPVVSAGQAAAPHHARIAVTKRSGRSSIV